MEGTGRDQKTKQNRGSREAPSLSIAGLNGEVSRTESELGLQGWRGSYVGTGPGCHLEGSLGPATEGLLLTAQLIALAQLQKPLPTQLFQSCVHRTSKSAEVGVRPGAQPEHTEPGGREPSQEPTPVPSSPSVPRELALPVRLPLEAPRPEGPQCPRTVCITGLLSLPPPGGHQRV